MQVKAIRSIIDWDAAAGCAVIINAGETGEISEQLARVHADAWEPMNGLPQLDHDGDGAPGGSLPDDPPSLTGKNKAELLAIAAAEGVAADDGMTKAQIVEAIEAARVHADDDGAGEGGSGEGDAPVE